MKSGSNGKCWWWKGLAMSSAMNMSIATWQWIFLQLTNHDDYGRKLREGKKGAAYLSGSPLWLIWDSTVGSFSNSSSGAFPTHPTGTLFPHSYFNHDKFGQHCVLYVFTVIKKTGIFIIEKKTISQQFFSWNIIKKGFHKEYFSHLILDSQ